MAQRSIADWISQAALACVHAQQILDRAWVRECEQFEAPAAGADDLAEALIGPLGPCRQVIARQEVEFSLAIGRTTSAKFTLGAEVINLNYMIAFRTRQEQHSRICVTVTNDPIA